MPAMVAPENDDRVVRKAVRVEGVEQLADLGVGVTDARVVRPLQLQGTFL